MADTTTLCLTIILVGVAFVAQKQLAPNYDEAIDDLEALFREQLKGESGEVTKFQKDLDDYKKDVHDILYQREEAKKEVGTYEPIGFHAYHGGDGIQASVYRDIVLESVDLNLGGHYDPTTGHFTCPESGFYYFTASTATVLEPAMHGFIYLYRNTSFPEDSAALGSIHMRVADFAGAVEKAEDQGEEYDYSELTYSRATNAAVTWCNKGWNIKLQSLTMGAIEGGPGNQMVSTLSGFLIDQ